MRAQQDLVNLVGTERAQTISLCAPQEPRVGAKCKAALARSSLMWSPALLRQMQATEGKV